MTANMDVIAKIAIILVPVLFALLGFFIKRWMDKSDESVKSANAATQILSNKVITEMASYKADLTITNARVADIDTKYQQFAHAVALNLAETKKIIHADKEELRDSQNRLQDSYRDLKRHVEDLIIELRRIAENVEKHSGSLSAAAQVMKAHQQHLVVVDEKLAEIGRVIWAEDREAQPAESMLRAAKIATKKD